MGSRDYIAQHAINRAMAGKISAKGNTDPMQSEVGKQSKNCVDNIGSTLLVAVNEPSQALYRIQEHIRKSVPRLVGRRQVAEGTATGIEGAIFDAEYSVEAVRSANRSLATFKGINDNLKSAVHLAQQIQHNHTHRPSMYDPTA